MGTALSEGSPEFITNLNTMGVVMRSGPVQQKAGMLKPLTVMRTGAEEVEVPEVEEVNEEVAEVLEELFICEECGKEAKSKAGLAAHMRSHTK